MKYLKQTSKKKLLSRLLLFLFLQITILAVPAISQIVISGTVLDQANKSPLNDTEIIITGIDDPSISVTGQSNEQGSFAFNLNQPGKYLLKVNRSGFHEIKSKSIDLITGINIVRIELIPFNDSIVTIDVYPEDNLSVEQISMSQALLNEELDSIPLSQSPKLRIKGMAAVLPGVLRDINGNVHFHGSSAEEVNWTLDGFTLSDPSSGKLEMGLGVESVKSLDLFSGRYSSEFGKGSGGTMFIQTRMGDEQVKQQFTNFFPGIEFTRGPRFSDWRPRHTFSGPIIKNRMWFFNSLDLLYKEDLIPELPVGQDRHVSWAVNNSLRIQTKITPRNTLITGFVMDYLNAPKSNLGPLNPLETTLDKRARRYFFNVKDKIVLSQDSILEFGYAAYRSVNRKVPQGKSPYQLTPFGRSGNFPIDSLYKGNRDQWQSNLFLPPKHLLGQHQLKIGLNLNYSRYFQDINRTKINYYRTDGSQASQFSFGGNGTFKESNLETGAYLQDRWAIQPRLVVEAGIRLDRDQIVSRVIITPRFSFAYMPSSFDNTKFSAGFGLIPGTTYFRLFTRHLDQYSIFTNFAKDGITKAGLPQVTFFTLDKGLLTIPRTQNLSFGMEQNLSKDINLNINYLRKRMDNGYTYVPIATSVLENSQLSQTSRATIYQLNNFKKEDYDSIEFSLSKVLFGDHRWFASYTYSRTYSNFALNFDTDQPMLFSNTAGRLAWDAPHRIVSWGLFPIGKKTSIVYFTEWRDGFPFSSYNDDGRQVGQINSWRLPRHFNLNVHIQRKFAFMGNLWSLRPGIDNITNRPNYSLVNNNLSSPEFLNLFGRQPRKFVIRLRWIGKSIN